MAVAQRKLVPESHRSAKPLRRAFLCRSQVLSVSVFLACSAGVTLLCFVFVDFKTFFYTPSGATSPAPSSLIPLRHHLDSTTNHSCEEFLAPLATPPTHVAINESTAPSVTPTVTDVEVAPESEVEMQSEGRDRRSLVGCDIYRGRWVYDESYPLYRSRNCPFVDVAFRCEENGRPDKDFMKYRWQPHDCDLPRFDARAMLERLRNQRLLFVGDSLGRNQWESMLCMLSEAVQNKSSIYEVNGSPIDKGTNELLFRFPDHNLTVEYYRDTFLVPQLRPPPGLPPNVTSVLRPDQMSLSAGKWHGANIMVFNSGHWWSWEKIGRPGGRFYVNDSLTNHSNEEAFTMGLKTWASWMEENLDPATSQVFFRSFASIHFRGGQWNKGGHCHEETHPLTDEEVKIMQPIPWTNKLVRAAIDHNIKEKRGAVEFMDVTTATDYRSDGHAGFYGKDVNTYGLPPINRQDCSHFCLPGVPDTWNELLFAALLARGQGVWGEPIRY